MLVIIIISIIKSVENYIFDIVPRNAYSCASWIKQILLFRQYFLSILYKKFEDTNAIVRM